MRFSERYGHIPVRTAIQVDDISQELRNSLWSALQLHIWKRVYLSGYMSTAFFQSNTELHLLFQQLWMHHFKRPIDNLSDNWLTTSDRIRQEFFEFEWYE
jgi:hypothetical protein